MEHFLNLMRRLCASEYKGHILSEFIGKGIFYFALKLFSNCFDLECVWQKNILGGDVMNERSEYFVWDCYESMTVRFIYDAACCNLILYHICTY